MNKLMNAKEVARILNISVAHAYVLMRRGDFPAIRMGKSVRVRPEDLEEYVAQHTRSSNTKYSLVKKSLPMGGD